MKYNFEHSASREDTNAEKYILKKQLFNTQDIEPVWVADMDIDTPKFIIKSIKKRLKHPIFGYEKFPKSALEAQQKWMKKYHNFNYKIEDVFYSPCVVASMNLIIKTFSNKGDKVIIQTPVYPQFFKSIINNDRVVLKNSLKKDGDRYTFDIEDLKSKIDKNTKLLLLCSPHNPVGRVWSKKELLEILEICLEHKIIVFSDEIHSDLVYKNHKHISFASLNTKAKEICITALGIGKTFNMAGFSTSTIVIQNENLKKLFLKEYTKTHFGEGCSISHIVFESVYKNGDRWLEELKIHLFQNYKLLQNLCEQHSHILKITKIQATYLAWIDCRQMNLSNKKLNDFFIKDAKLGLIRGIAFGREGDGFMRLNFAVSKIKMRKIVELLDRAIKKRFPKNG